MFAAFDDTQSPAHRSATKRSPVPLPLVKEPRGLEPCHENFGNVVVEALACGCAVAISDKTGVGGDLLNGAPSSFGAVLPRQVNAWRDWLATWLQNPQRAGNLCAEWVAQTYGSAAVADQAIAVYRQILEAH